MAFAAPAPTHTLPGSFAQCASRWPVFVCLLGNFGLLKHGTAVPLRARGRSEALLATLAVHHRRPVSREALLNQLWPNAESSFSGQSLNSVVHSLHKLLGDALNGGPPVVHVQGSYRLNGDAGVGVDIAWFDELSALSLDAAQAAPAEALDAYVRAIEAYGGDLCFAGDPYTVIERERLRARYLTLLARAASHCYAHADPERCLGLAMRLLEHDPCREDAHRLVMRCHVRLNERAQALRQYDLCQRMLKDEFDVEPEPATSTLYELVRRNPTAV